MFSNGWFSLTDNLSWDTLLYSYLQNFNDEITNILTWTDSADSTAYSFFCGTVSGHVYIHKLRMKQHSESYNVEVGWLISYRASIVLSKDRTKWY